MAVIVIILPDLVQKPATSTNISNNSNEMFKKVDEVEAIVYLKKKVMLSKKVDEV
jgi:hypothetical protein